MMSIEWPKDMGARDVKAENTSGTQHSALDTHSQHFPVVRRLLIRGPNWIGDAVMCEPALSAVRALFPAARIALLVKPSIAELFAGHPACDEIVLYDSRARHAGLSGKWRLSKDLKREGYDLAVLFQNAFEAAFLAWLSGIPRRYGYATDGRGWLLTDPVAVADQSKAAHQTRYYVDLLRPLGWDGQARAPRLVVSDSESQAIEQRLAAAGIGSSERLIGLNPGSTYGGAKRWLPERFADVADRLASSHSARIVIVGAAGEEILGQTIAGAMRTKAIVLSGRTSIRELMAVVQRCHLFLTNDTGPMHIAAALGVPVVAIFGPTNSRTTSPWGDAHRIVRRPVECSPCLLRECPIDHRCMTHISVDDVYQAAVEQFQTMNVECEMMNAGISDQNPNRGAQPSSVQTAPSSVLRPQSLSLSGVTVFLDRDGTLNRDTGYVRSAQELELLPAVPESLARLNQAGARLVLITNQSGIARGLLTIDSLRAIHEDLCARLQQGGARLDAIYYCPHHPDDQCGCRKPQIGMITRAVSDLDLDLARSYVVGDQTRDVELARRIGARSILVTTGPTSHQALASMQAEGVSADYVSPSFDDAVNWVFADVKARYPLSVNR